MTPRYGEGHQLGLRYVELIKRLNDIIVDMKVLREDSANFGVDFGTLSRIDGMIDYLNIAAIDNDKLDAKVAEVEAELAEKHGQPSV